MHDRAFDRCLITVDEKRSLCVGPELREAEADPVIAAHFMAYAGMPLTLPEKFEPKGEHFAYHRELALRLRQDLAGLIGSTA
jgi:hypothetical protein